MPLSVEEGSGASSRSKGVRMAQAGSAMGIGALELLLSGRTVPGLSVSVVKGQEESVEAGEILTDTVRGDSPRLPP